MLTFSFFPTNSTNWLAPIDSQVPRITHCKAIIIYHFLSPGVTIFVELRIRKIGSLTTFCNLKENLEPQYWLNSC
jgi:hypothetical protein